LGTAAARGGNFNCWHCGRPCHSSIRLDIAVSAGFRRHTRDHEDFYCLNNLLQQHLLEKLLEVMALEFRGLSLGRLFASIQTTSPADSIRHLICSLYLMFCDNWHAGGYISGYVGADINSSRTADFRSERARFSAL